VNTIELLTSHRSIRKFSDKKIPQELLLKIFRSGQAAATSSFAQAYSIIRICDAEKRQKLAELCGKQKYVASCAEFLVCCADLHRNKGVCESLEGDTDPSYMEQFIVATVDVSLMAQNMVVAAESEGLGICYIGGIRNEIEEVAKLLALPKYVYPVFGLCLGYPLQDPEPKPRLPVSNVFMTDTYQAPSEENIAAYDKEISAYYAKRTENKKTSSWTEELRGHFTTKTRPHMLKFLQSMGLAKR